MSNKKDFSREAYINVTYKHSARTVFILGTPRSGTSWLGKILDSHPDVLYRHEPDIIDRNETLPFLCEPERAASYVANAQSWLDDLAKNRFLKSAGSQPVFRKSYHTPLQTRFRRLIVTALRTAGQIPGIRNLAQSIPIPDFVDLASRAYGKLVIKSVSCMGRARILAEAAPDSRFILIIRHPCGQVASMRQGVEESRFEHEIPILSISETEQARRRSLTAERLAQLPYFEQLTWSWTIHNEKALEDLQGAEHLMVLRYEDLTESPEEMSRRIFDFCEIDWRPENLAFLADSSRATGREGYYQTRRNPVEAANRWRRFWSQDEIDAIFEIAAQSDPGRMFLTDGNILERA